MYVLLPLGSVLLEMEISNRSKVQFYELEISRVELLYSSLATLK